MVAVLVPVYNLEQIIPFCIDSILSQTYINIRLIIVDDGSTDNSLKVLKQYEKIDNRVTVIYQQNRGLGEARNTLVEAARNVNADYLTFVDGDDLIEATYVEKLLQMIIKTGCSVSWVSERGMNVDDYQKGYIPTGKYPPCKKNKVYKSHKLLQNEFLRVQYSFVWGKMYETSLFDGIVFPSRIYEDGFTTYKLLYKAKKIAFNNSQLYICGSRNDSITHQRIKKQYIVDGLDTIIEQRAFYENKKEAYLASCTYAGLLNDILMWHTKVENSLDKLDFNAAETMNILHKMLNDNIEQITKAPNIDFLTKCIARACCKDMHKSRLYFYKKEIYFCIKSAKNKLYRLGMLIFKH